MGCRWIEWILRSALTVPVLPAVMLPLPWSTYRSQPPAGIQVSTSPGVLYSTKAGNEAAPGTLAFWWLHRSKKVWFRLDPHLYGQPIPHSFTYRGRPIRYGGDQGESGGRSGPGEPAPIYWEERMESGWGHGPRQTNFFLSILSRWSLWHLAGAHPESFQVTYWRPTKESAGRPRGWARANRLAPSRPGP